MAASSLGNQLQSDRFDQLEEKYLIKQEVGRTQASSLFKAVDKASGRATAIKVFRRKYSADPRFALKFRNHLREMFKLENEGLVSILDYGLADGRYYIASEWVSGQDLSTLITQAGVLDQLQAVAIASQICQALDFIHRRGLLHLNLKPQNILLSADSRVKLSDAGLSGLISESGLSRTHVMIGRFHYIAPEQVAGQEPAPGADIYSLGIILYEMLTGHLPFDARDVWDVLRMHVEFEPPSIDKLNPKISDSLVKVIQRSLQKSPEDRFPSAGEMNAALIAISEENNPAQEDMQIESIAEVWNHFISDLRQGKSFLQRTVPFRILGKSYPFGLVILVQFLASFLLSFLCLSIVFTLIRLIR